MSYGDYLREKNVNEERARVCELLLSEEIGLVEGVRRIVERSRFLGFVFDDNIRFLEQIDLQSEHFPLGDSRKQYDDTRLKALDKERQQFESDNRDTVHECCRQILRQMPDWASTS